jgi:hypothetical protein
MHALVRNTMLGDAGVVAALGQNVHWSPAPKGCPYPMVVLQLISEREGYALDGPTGLTHYLIQMDVCADRHSDLRLGKKAVKRLWGGFASGEILGAFVKGVREDHERGRGETGPEIYRASIDTLIIVKEQNT